MVALVVVIVLLLLLAVAIAIFVIRTSPPAADDGAAPKGEVIVNQM